MFKEERKESLFEWSMLGDVREGRPNLGNTMNVDVYRLMQFTLRDTMVQQIGVKATDDIFYKAGKKAGEELYHNVIKESTDVNDFVLKLQSTLKDMSIGILRVEKADLETQHFVLTIAEDLDCSGLSICEEEICVYDEGFVSGLFKAYTGNEYSVTEVDCWCSGDRVCRFDVTLG